MLTAISSKDLLDKYPSLTSSDILVGFDKSGKDDVIYIGDRGIKRICVDEKIFHNYSFIGMAGDNYIVDVTGHTKGSRVGSFNELGASSSLKAACRQGLAKLVLRITKLDAAYVCYNNLLDDMSDKGQMTTEAAKGLL